MFQQHIHSARVPSLRSPDYWAGVFGEAAKFQWSKRTLLGALFCLPVMAGWIVWCMFHGSGQSAVFAIAGAFSISFGAFQQLAKSRTRTMLLLLAATALGAWLGDMAGHIGWYVSVILAVAFGYAFGALTMLGYGAWWISLQCMIALIVYGSHAAPPPQAARDALAIAAGGGSQALFLAALMPLVKRWFLPQDQAALNITEPLFKAILRSASPATPGGKYALRVAAAVGAASFIAHFWAMPNGYWCPMTAAILMKPDFNEATIRGVNRLIGTLAGAGLTTILVASWRPNMMELGFLLLPVIWACLAVMRVNYALFAACVTSYVVLLFSMLGLPGPAVAMHRCVATLAGAAVALLASVCLFPRGCAPPDHISRPRQATS